MSKFSRLGNDLYTGKKSINFVGRRNLWYAISAVIVIVALSGLFVRGVNWGIEFVGGTEYKVTVPSSDVNQETADKLGAAVADSGIDEASSPVVNTSGETTIIVQTEKLPSDDETQEVRGILAETAGVQADDVSVSEVGASWGRDVAKQSLTGLAVFIVLVILLIWGYFREWKMSVGAIVALAHDLIITIGIYAWSGFEVTPATVTGLLTILGFSLYDTVVVFDKVRENTKAMRQNRQTYAQAANLAVNQTLVRSINTSIVALLPVGAILYVGAVQLGSGTLKDLALSQFVGMAAGAYSSIFIATPLVVQLKSREKDVLAAEKRASARQRAADRYATVPTYKDDLPMSEEPSELDDAPPPDPDADTEPVTAERPATREPVGLTKALGKPPKPGSGRTAPAARGPVGESKASGRVQPSRKPRSQRGK